MAGGHHSPAIHLNLPPCPSTLPFSHPPAAPVRPTRVKCTAPNHRNRRFELALTRPPAQAGVVWLGWIRWELTQPAVLLLWQLAGRVVCRGCRRRCMFVGVMSQRREL